METIDCPNCAQLRSQLAAEQEGYEICIADLNKAITMIQDLQQQLAAERGARELAKVKK